MKTAIAIGLVVAQIAVLGYMAGERECVLRTGRTVYLRTAPLDPRDPMRGDYARFAYEIGHVPKRLCHDEIAGWSASDWREQRAFRDRLVFVQIKPDDEGVAQLVGAFQHEPPGLSLRARVSAVQPAGLDVRFGVEALFMEQGKAKALEQSREARAGVPLNIEVAVGADGLAVMKGYRWEPLGITLAFDRVERPAGTRTRPENPPVLRGVTVELKNHGDKPIAIVALPEGRSFRLVADERWQEPRYRWVGEDVAAPKPTPKSVRVLAPGESYRERIDFTAPAWWLRDVRHHAGDRPAEPVSWERLDQPWATTFRIEYVPPSRADCAGLPQADLIRHSRLPSRAFGPAATVD